MLPQGEETESEIVYLIFSKFKLLVNSLRMEENHFIYASLKILKFKTILYLEKLRKTRPSLIKKGDGQIRIKFNAIVKKKYNRNELPIKFKEVMPLYFQKILPDGNILPNRPNRSQTVGTFGEKVAYHYLKEKYLVYINNKPRYYGLFNEKNDSHWKNLYHKTHFFSPFTHWVDNKEQLNKFLSPYNDNFDKILNKLLTSSQIDFFCKTNNEPAQFYLIEVKSSDISCDNHDKRGPLNWEKKQKNYFKSISGVTDLLKILLIKVNFCKSCEKIFLWECSFS